MTRQLLIGLFLVGTSLIGFGQARIGFTNLNGFPDIILGSQTYTLSGWLVNRGQDTLHDGVDILMSANGGSNIPVDNNFLLAAPLAPGDSMYWSKSGHSFPGGQLAPGNNDVLIWPTRMQGGGDTVLSDSLQKPIFYASDAAFRVRDNGLEDWTVNGIALETSYDLDLVVQNVGEIKNDGAVGVFIQINAFDPVMLEKTSTTFEAGTEMVISVEDFVLQKYLDEYYPSLPAGFQADVKLYAQEIDGLPPYSPLAFKSAAVEDIAPFFDPVIFPNPVQSGFDWQYDPELHGSILRVELFDAQGALIHSSSGASKHVDMAELSPGYYVVRFQSTAKTWSVNLLKK